jgi:hypothetical protein
VTAYKKTKAKEEQRGKIMKDGRAPQLLSLSLSLSLCPFDWVPLCKTFETLTFITSRETDLASGHISVYLHSSTKRPCNE